MVTLRVCGSVCIQVTAASPHPSVTYFCSVKWWRSLFWCLYCMYIQYICRYGSVVSGKRSRYVHVFGVWSEKCILIFNGLFPNRPSSWFFFQKRKPDLNGVVWWHRNHLQWFYRSSETGWIESRTKLCDFQWLLLRVTRYPRPLYSHGCFLVGFFFTVFLLFCWSFSHVGQNRRNKDRMLR